MERHDTHILSDSQEDDENEESEHPYIFNNSQNSENNSFKNTIQSNSKRDNKYNFNDLIIENKNPNNQLNDDSLISSKDLEDLFYDEDRFTRALIKKKEIEEQKKREKEKKQKQEEDESKKIPDSVKIKLIKLNYDDNISVFNKLLTYTPDLINKLKIKKIQNKKLCLSFEKEKIKRNEKNKSAHSREDLKKNLRIKKRPINLDNSDSISDSSYNNNKKRNNKTNTNTNNNNFNNKININTNTNKIKVEGKKMKNLFDILKNNNLKSFKISTNSFTILTRKYKNSIEVDKKIKKRIKSSKPLAFHIRNQIQRQNNFSFKNNMEHNILKKYNFSPGIMQINNKKQFQILQSKDKDKQDFNSKMIIMNNKNSQYSLRYHNNKNNILNNNRYLRNRYSSNDYNNDINNYNYDYNNINNDDYYNNICDDYISSLKRMKNSNMSNPNKNFKYNAELKLKNDKKIKILYDLYCKVPNKENKSINRINSAFTIKKDRYGLNQNINNLMPLNDNAENMIKKRLYNSNKNKNWLLKLIKIQKDKNMYHYEKHFGNNENCPLCQQMEQKNEEQIRKIGVYHLGSDSKSNSKKKRKINSAFTSSHHKNYNGELSKEMDFDNESRNNLHYNKSTAAFNEFNLSRKLRFKNQLKPNFQFKQKCMNSNYS